MAHRTPSHSQRHRSWTASGRARHTRPSRRPAEHVGLPVGQIGNSEVGHLNIGAGDTVLQDLPRIDHEIETGEFFKNVAPAGAVEHVKAGRSAQTGGHRAYI